MYFCVRITPYPKGKAVKVLPTVMGRNRAHRLSNTLKSGGQQCNGEGPAAELWGW